MLEFVRTAERADSARRLHLAQRVGTDQCYYHGIQFINTRGIGAFATTTTGRLLTQWNPDVPNLRITANEITEKITVAAAATYPTSLSASIEPPSRDCGVSQSVYTQCLEDALDLWTKKSNLLLVARDVNTFRCVCGDYGIRLAVKTEMRPVVLGGATQLMPSKTIKAYEVYPTNYILDPAMTSRRLADHNYVVYTDVLTETAIRSQFPGIDIKSEDLSTVGQLMPYEMALNSLSGAVLFGRYRQYSETKGARVYEIHAKGPDGRFSEYYVGVEIPGKDIKWVNADNPISPFGGNGLPHAIIRGHRRADGTPWSISDVSMARDPQDVLNLMMTQLMRSLLFFSNPRTIIDSRWFSAVANKEDFRQQFTDQVGGLIVGRPASMDKSIAAPRVEPMPQPPPMMMEMMEMAKDSMRRKTFRTDMNAGLGLKTHIPLGAQQTALQEADRVPAIRVGEDAESYQDLQMVLLGTGIRHVQERSASTLADLDEDGFDEQDIAILLNADPIYPTCGIKISEGNIRYRSANEKKADLVTSATNQQITPLAYRRGLAELDNEVLPEDKYMRQELEKAAARLLNGEPWTPMPLGEHNEWCLSILRRAQFDRKSKANPQILALVQQAIQAQVQIGVQEQMASDPNIIMQQQQAQMQAEQQAQQQQEEAGEGEEDQPQTIADVVDRMSRAG